MISLIVAADKNNAIGYENNLLCHLKDDMRHFVDTTTGKPVIMGSKTFASLGNKPLKDRANIVLTSSPLALYMDNFQTIEENDNLVFEDFEYIQYMIEQSPELEFMVIGGQQTYELFIPFADRIYLTTIYHSFDKADAFFPEFTYHEWVVTDNKTFEKDENNEYPFTILTLDKRRFYHD